MEDQFTPVDELKIPAFMRRRKLQQRAKKPTTLARHMQSVRKKAKKAKKENSAVYIERAVRKTVLAKKKTTLARKITKSKPVATITPAIEPITYVEDMDHMATFEAPIMEQTIEQPVEESVKEKPIGVITHFFDKIDVAVIRLSAQLRENDIILITGEDGEFEQIVDSMQHNRKPIKRASKGKEIGIKVPQRPKINEVVYKI